METDKIMSNIGSGFVNVFAFTFITEYSKLEQKLNLVKF